MSFEKSSKPLMNFHKKSSGVLRCKLFCFGNSSSATKDSYYCPLGLEMLGSSVVNLQVQEEAPTPWETVMPENPPGKLSGSAILANWSVWGIVGVPSTGQLVRVI